MKIVLKKVRDLKDPFKYIEGVARLNEKEVMELYYNFVEGSPLTAVKYLKDTTGLGLKEAKAFCDEFRYLCWRKGINLGVSKPEAGGTWEQEWIERRKNEVFLNPKDDDG